MTSQTNNQKMPLCPLTNGAWCRTECAWFDRMTEQCSMLSIANSLDKLAREAKRK